MIISDWWVDSTATHPVAHTAGSRRSSSCSFGSTENVFSSTERRRLSAVGQTLGLQDSIPIGDPLTNTASASSESRPVVDLETQTIDGDEVAEVFGEIGSSITATVAARCLASHRDAIGRCGSRSQRLTAIQSG
jgi:hypothetical protein